MTYLLVQIEAAAQAAHECNRAYCITLGDFSQVCWEEAPTWQKKSAINGVQGVANGNGPEQSHESWLKEKKEAGWTYGEVKDPDKKTHPCFVPYAELPPACRPETFTSILETQKKKDNLFVSVVTAMLNTFYPDT